MRKTIILSFLCLFFVAQTNAQRISCRFNNASMAEALRTINNMQKDYTVNFIYDDLEDFRVTTTIKSKHTPEAIQQLIGFYPIKQTQDGHNIFVECTHKTARHMSGRITDEQGNPVEFANIALLSVKDSTLTDGGVSNASGVFIIPSDAKESIVRVSHVGYTTYFRHAETGDIGTIRLIQTSVNLKNVTIKAENIHNTSTGYTFIMASSGLENSTSINSAFAMLPGVSIADEKISLFGNLPVIYVDGFKITSQEELKGLSPDRIKKIDVQYLSTGESAFTKGGVIYITTRKALQGGYTGYLGMTVNESANYGHVKDSPYFTLNASMGKWSSNLWIRHNHQKLYEDAEYETHFSDNSQTKEYGETRSWHNNLAGRLNLTRELTNKSFVAVSQYVSFANVKDSYLGHKTSWKNNVMTFDEKYQITGPDKTNTSQSVLKYQTETDDKGSSFSITGDYLHQWDRI